MSAERDLDLRRRYGVFTTPQPLVRYVVRSVHGLLQDKLGWSAGLADARARLLDPAAGSMGFLRAAWRQAIAAHGRCDACLTGVEILPQEHARGLAATARLAAAAGCARPEARLTSILGDALAPPPELLEQSFNVVLGNPPWSGRSRHRGPWMTGLLRGYDLPDGRSEEGYFRLDGGQLGERNPKWVNDEYVKFLRLAQWLIDRNGEGVAGLVLNHNFLDAPTFRGLRRSLLRTFQEIYVLDLHGNRRKRERGPDGRPESNVFRGVAQGAALVLLVRHPGLRPRIFRADLHGSRGEKLAVLARSCIATTAWTEIEPSPPAYLYIAGDKARERDFLRGLSLPEIFPIHGSGIITGRDRVVTALDRKALERRLAGREEIERISGWRARITTYLARPFDLRAILYADALLERPRRELMGHLLNSDNIGLLALRQGQGETGALVTRWIAGHKVISSYDVNSLFPLYVGEGSARRPNLAPDLVHRLGALAGLAGNALAPEDILGYVYAVLSSPGYRRRYRDLLRRSFPRIVFPADACRLRRLAGLGRELIDLHLLRDPRLRSAREEISPEVWDYRIGDYPVLRQWLQARRLRACSGSKELRRIAEALRLTLEVQRKIGDVGDVEYVEDIGEVWR